MARCVNCLIEDSYPGVHLVKGMCALCVDFGSRNLRKAEDIRKQSQKEFKELLQRNKKHKQSTYDCVIALSGGKDSSYLSWLAVHKFGLRPLAVTVDTGFLSEAARGNIKRITEKLGMEHFFVRASAFFRFIYRYAFTHHFFSSHQGLACGICSCVIPNIVFNVAVQKGVPLVMSGKFNPENPVLFRKISEEIALPEDIERLLSTAGFGEGLFFLNDRARCNESSLPLIVHPLNLIKYREDKLRKALCKYLGAEDLEVFSPRVTNCSIAVATMWLYKKMRGYNPYGNDISEWIRWGMFERKRWKGELARADNLLKDSHIKNQVLSVFRTLGISGI